MLPHIQWHSFSGQGSSIADARQIIPSFWLSTELICFGSLYLWLCPSSLLGAFELVCFRYPCLILEADVSNGVLVGSVPTKLLTGPAVGRRRK
jgi:hypothetical protein